MKQVSALAGIMCLKGKYPAVKISARKILFIFAPGILNNSVLLVVNAKLPECITDYRAYIDVVRQQISHGQQNCKSANIA